MAENEKKKRVNVSLDQETIELAKQIATGNLSKGIRMAVEAWHKEKDVQQG